jgi:predicted RNase H-like HicB family nuclease
MKVGILIEKICEDGYPDGYYYAHAPSLGLTTHGLGIEGAISAIKDLIRLWIDEKKANNEDIHSSTESLYSILEIEEYAIQS